VRVEKLVLSQNSRRVIGREARDRAPLESGGMLIGSIGNRVASIHLATGPGPRAHHSASGFRRDGSYSQRLLDDHGLRAVFIARLLPLARTFVSLPAGAGRLPLVPFVALTTLGCALWATAFVIVGLLSGTAWVAVSSVLGKALLGVGVAVLLAFVHNRGVGSFGKHRYAVGDQRRRAEVSDEKKSADEHPGWPSRSADAAAARWGESHPEEDPEHPPPAAVPEDEEVVPNRHSASAEAASLRWHEQHEDE